LKPNNSLTFAKGNLKDTIRRDERGEASQTLFTGTADTNQQCVTARAFDDAADARNMVHGVFEKHQVHDGVHFVMLLESVFQNFLERRVVLYGLVLALAHATGKVRVDERRRVECRVIDVFKRLLRDFLDDTAELLSVAVLHHLVAVDAVTLVNPEADKVNVVLDQVILTEQDALENVGQVTQILK
jgi:hypothetical protein